MTASEFLQALATGSAIIDTDNVVVYSSGGEALKIPAKVVKAYLINGITPQFRNQGNGIEMSVDGGTTWDVLVTTTELGLRDYANDLNIDKLYPLSTGYYTLSTAIATITDSELKKAGVKIIFQSASGIFETWQFKSVIGNWSTLSYWEIVTVTGRFGNTDLVTNVNTISRTGPYTCYGTATGVPDPSYSWFIQHINSSVGTTYATQEATAYSTTIIKKRRNLMNGVWGAWELMPSRAEIDTNTADIAELKLGNGKYHIGGWNPDDLSPVPTTRLGDQTWSRNLSGIYLFDMTLNTGDVMYPVGELDRANWLRFTDGSFAPTIGITEAMRATCDVDLYLDNAQTTLYSAAGAFDAASFYNTYGMSQKLYDASGNKVRILRPWETVETKYHIGFAFREKVWLIDGLGDSGKYWQGPSQHDITWDGVKGVPLEKTAFSPGPATSVGNKMRNFFFLYNTGDSNTASASGQSGLCTLFSGLNRQFPRVNDISQITNMNYARANNTVTTNSYPVAEGGYHTLNSIISRAEVLYNTRYLHNPSLFGSGISSNDTCNSEATFLANGGFKYKKSADSTWKYCTLGATPAMYYNVSGGTTNASTWLNGQYPKEQCLESQMAASFAKETGVSINTDFVFYGSTYQYRNITGVLGLADGYMNVIVTKVISQTISAYDNTGTATNYDISCCLRMSLIDGMNLSGDIFEYAGGGFEQVGTNISTTQPHIGDTVSLYVQPDQRKWHNDSTVSKNNLGVFDFEKTYTRVGSVVTVGDNYAKKRLSLTPYKIQNGGSIATGQCYYQYENNYWSNILKQRVRVGSRFRGFAYYGTCSPRCMHANVAVSYASVSTGGSAQILMG